LQLLAIPRTDDDFSQPFETLRDDLADQKELVTSSDRQRLVIDLSREGTCRTLASPADLAHTKESGEPADQR